MSENGIVLNNCSQVLTMTGDGLGIVEHGAVRMKDGRIAEVADRNLAVEAGETEIDCKGRVVMPGFVDLATLAWTDVGLLALMLVMVIGGVNTGYALLATRARHFLANERAQRAIQRTAGALMFVAAALVATPV